MDYRDGAPELIRRFLTYHETIRGHSKKTADEYFLDLRTFFRYLKRRRGLVPKDLDFEKIPIDDVDLDFVKAVTLDDVYEYLSFLSRDRVRYQNSRDKSRGLGAKTRARKIASIRSFYKYLSAKVHLLDENPMQELESPKINKALPRFLTLDESKRLLASVGGANRERDLCILTLFLNCGLRISEMVGLDLADIHEDHIVVLGKGGKQRVVYLNDACVGAINSYLEVRKGIPAADKNALFVTKRRSRISRSTVHELVKKHIAAAGLDSGQYSAHKLRHTAATLMLHNGVDIKALQELLGHEHLNTTEIYTHVESTDLRIAAKANPLAGFDPEDFHTESH